MASWYGIHVNGKLDTACETQDDVDYIFDHLKSKYPNCELKIAEYDYDGELVKWHKNIE